MAEFNNSVTGTEQKILPKYSDFVHFYDCIGEILSISIRKNLNLLETLIFEPMKVNLNAKTLDL